MQHTNITIKKVNVSDAAELLEIYSFYVENTAISFETQTPSLQEFQNRITTISKSFPYIKAVSPEEKILGYAYATTFKGRKAYDWAVETTIYIHKKYHQQGIGRQLYLALEQSLKNMGILNLNACIAMPVSPDPYLTEDSYKFHSKLGYTTVGTFNKCGFKFNTWYNMIWMEKLIGEHSANPKPVEFGNWTINNL